MFASLRLRHASISIAHRCRFLQISARNSSQKPDPECNERSLYSSSKCKSLSSSSPFHAQSSRDACLCKSRVNKIHAYGNRTKHMLPASAYRGLSGMPEEENSSSSPVSQNASDDTSPLERSLIKACTVFTQLFPFWCILAAVSGFYHPPLYLWFDTQCISNGLIFIMLGMGLTLTLAEITTVFVKQPQLLLLGMVLQYSVLPLIGYTISRNWGLEQGLAVGVALVSCMPGGTASNIMAFIAKGDMGLSLMMTTASTLMAIVMTPLLTLQLVGTLVPVDGKAMFLSVLQLVLAPVLIGASVNTYFPQVVKRVKPFMPFAATTMCVLIIGSMVSANVTVVKAAGIQILTAVTVLHSCGFFLGYVLSKGLGLSDKIARTNSIEVGMQSSALAGVLARLHFTDPVVVAPCVLSAVVMCTLGSILSGIWSVTVKDGE